MWALWLWAKASLSIIYIVMIHPSIVFMLIRPIASSMSSANARYHCWFSRSGLVSVGREPAPGLIAADSSCERISSTLTRIANLRSDPPSP